MSAAELAVRAPATSLDRIDVEQPITDVTQDELAQLPAMGILKLLMETAKVNERILVWIHA